MVNVRISDLSFSYNTKKVFYNMSLSVERGEVLSVVGRNGAGKSTLIKCINHIFKPSGGSVFIGEDDVSQMSHIQRAKKFGYLAQRSENFFPMTVYDTVLAGRFPHSPLSFTRNDEKIVAEILDSMGLLEFAQRTVDQLSGGEQQQVLIARALAQSAGVLLFDEPTNNLDLKHQLQIMRLVRKIAKEKKIISILAIHDLNLAAGFSDKIVMLHKGGIYAFGRPADVFTIPNIYECFGVRVKIYDHGGIPHIVMIDE